MFSELCQVQSSCFTSSLPLPSPPPPSPPPPPPPHLLCLFFLYALCPPLLTSFVSASVIIDSFIALVSHVETVPGIRFGNMSSRWGGASWRKAGRKIGRKGFFG